MGLHMQIFSKTLFEMTKRRRISYLLQAMPYLLKVSNWKHIRKMSSVSANAFITSNFTSSQRRTSRYCTDYTILGKFSYYPQLKSSQFCRKRRTLVFSKSNGESSLAVEDEWLKKLPDKTKPLYAHSIPCIEAWLKNLGFYQSKDDVSVWIIEKVDWHAQLSLDVTDLCIRSEFLFYNHNLIVSELGLDKNPVFLYEVRV